MILSGTGTTNSGTRRRAGFAALLACVTAVAVAMPSAAAAGGDGTTTATITTQVFDRATGAPVGKVCVLAISVYTTGVPQVCPARSGGGGRVTVPVSEPGSYNLFVLPNVDSPYGAQWVGPTGGTGTQLDARRITLAVGESKRAPKVLLDPRATISGQVTAETGAIVGGVADLFTPSAITGHSPRQVPLDGDGSFSIDWAGPYGWPVVFRGDNIAQQWSGPVATRRRADLAPATVGDPEPVSYHLRTGAQITVTVPDVPLRTDRRLVFFHSSSRGLAGAVSIDSDATTATQLISGGQHIKIQCLCDGTVRWYGGGTSIEKARSVNVSHRGVLHLTM
ncbi:hypothetical protein [Micromonospora sp. NBC_01813]|uniref:hypothetical protein n=1 Tax=Micromonospora sp. NBC_01813 TaxID=2975988 RepID=UPI002DDA0F0C|nr:hypothetical protein [Micromonospora sp. NBC_01813]WSA10341.1 hypothetical protein OG958_05975 [Micromonospora sp. NBC_01813]